MFVDGVLGKRAPTGCDTVSPLPRKRKTKALSITN